MKERRYKEEYKLVTQLDGKTGKPKQIPVYMGDYYTMPEGARGRRKMLVHCLWLGAYLLSYGAYVLGSSPSTYCIYVLPVASMAMIPTLYALLGAASMLRCDREMTRVERENGVGRVMRSLLGCCVLTGLAAIGDVIFMLRSGAAGEMLPFLMLAISCAAAGLGFAALRRVYNAMTIRPGRAKLAQQKALEKQQQEQQEKEARE